MRNEIKKQFLVEVHLKGRKMQRMFTAPDIPRVGDFIWVGNGNWKITGVSWGENKVSNMMEPSCYISFSRDSDDAYWTKPKFWIDNGFVEHYDGD